MKKLLLLLFFPLCFSNSVQACPACNIHNYMYGSILDSENIYVGRIAGKDRRIVIEKVIKGNYQIGDTVNHHPFIGFRGWDESYVFCNQGEGDFGGSMYYDLYYKEDIAEIELILKNDSVYRNDREALMGIMGISSESVYMARQYFSNQGERLYSSLIPLADSLNQLAYNKDKYLSFYEWRIENLHGILLQHSDDPAVQAYLHKWIELFTEKGQREEIEWHKKNYGVNAREASEFYSSLLQINTPEDSARNRSIVEILMKKLPQQNSQGALDICFALLYSPGVTAEKLSCYITPENFDAFAIAVYRSSILGFWNNIKKETIHVNLVTGIPYAQKKWLKKLMEEELES